MAHKTLIDGTAYNVVGGSSLIQGTSYHITAGRTLIDGTGYDIPLTSGTNSFDWVGWDNATWEDINNLCVAKQRGIIDEWPDDVVLGAEKMAVLKPLILQTERDWPIIIGIDIDGEGTLTFQSKGCLHAPSRFSGNSLNRWMVSDARAKCQEYYNAVSCKDHILTIRKGTNTSYNSDDGIVYNNETVWLPSAAEMNYRLGASSSKFSEIEFTEGNSIPYPYYIEKINRIKYIYDYGGNQSSKTYSYWIRSAPYSPTWTSYDSHGQGEISSGVYTTNPIADYQNLYLSPAFVIGNPEVATI